MRCLRLQSKYKLVFDRLERLLKEIVGRYEKGISAALTRRSSGNGLLP